jgi:hypothetical protein
MYVQNCNSYINIPLSQNYTSYSRFEIPINYGLSCAFSSYMEQHERIGTGATNLNKKGLNVASMWLIILMANISVYSK